MFDADADADADVGFYARADAMSFWPGYWRVAIDVDLSA